MAALRPLSDLGEWFSMIGPSSRFDLRSWYSALSRKFGPQFLVIQGLVQLGSCFIAPFTPALIIARLRQPRPPLRQIIYQPGFIASVALCVVLLIVVDVMVFGLISYPPVIDMVMPGATVLISWLALLVIGRWRPETSWVDHCGRVVGIFWLATIPWSIWMAW